MSILADGLATALWTYTKAVIDMAKKTPGISSNYKKFMKYRGAFIKEYTEGEAVWSDASSGKVFFSSAGEFISNSTYTPIFPVSDAAGYEVIGNLPYGRGVNIASYYDLTQSRITGEETDSAAEAADSSFTEVGSSGSNAASLEALEKFIIRYFIWSNESPEEAGKNALQGLSTSEQSAVLATLNTTSGDIETAVQTLTNKDLSQKVKIRNSPVTSHFRGHSEIGDVSSANLADLDVSGDICSCKGADASFFLQAFSEEFIDLYDDPVQGYAEQLATQTSVAWKQAKDAMSGQAPDSRASNLIEEVARKASSTAGPLRSTPPPL